VKLVVQSAGVTKDTPLEISDDQQIPFQTRMISIYHFCNLI